MDFGNKFKFDGIGDGADVSLINTEINEIEWVLRMSYFYESGFLSSFLPVSFPKSLWRLVFGFFIFYLFKSFQKMLCTLKKDVVLFI